MSVVFSIMYVHCIKTLVLNFAREKKTLQFLANENIANMYLRFPLTAGY